MRKKGNFFVAVVLIVICAVFVSCNNSPLSNEGTQGRDIVSVSLSPDKAVTSRALAASSDTTISSFKYKAESTPSGLYGEQTTFADLTVDAGKASIELEAGSWTITIQGYNAKGGLLAEGVVTENISKTKNSITCKLVAKTNTTGTAQVKFDLGVPTLVNGSLDIQYKLISGASFTSMNTASFTKTVGQSSGGTALSNYTRYVDNTTLKLAPGNYLMSVAYKDGTEVISGQMLAFRVVEDTDVNITGTLTAGEYITVDIDVETEATTIDLSLAGSVSSQTFTATVSTADVTDLSYTWYIGVTAQSSTAATMNFKPTNPGTYNITCIATGKLNGELICGFASLELTYTSENIAAL